LESRGPCGVNFVRRSGEATNIRFINFKYRIDP
jgi:hypothetical protein